MKGIRIIGGTAKGRRLELVPGDSTRPVTDRVKENLFNIIGVDIVGSSLLDVFGGTGSVGIEALSRGAGFARFLDLNRRAIQTIKSNLEIAGFSAKADVLKRDAFIYLEGPMERSFDYVYVAPPQYEGLWARALFLIDENPGWLKADGWVIVQIDPREYQPQGLSNLELIDQRKYGNTLLVFYERRDETT